MFQKDQIKLLILVLVLAPAILVPRSWIDSRVDMVFMSNFLYAEEGFSVSIPRMWFVHSGAADVLRYAYSQRNHVLRAGNHRRRVRLRYSVSMYVRTAELPAGAAVYADELVRGSSWMYGGRARFLAREADTRTEVKSLRDRQWHRTTFAFDDDSARVFWHTVDRTNNRARLYIVAFFTDSFSNFEPVFDRIMESFTILP